jgi:neutral ceramidase
MLRSVLSVLGCAFCLCGSDFLIGRGAVKITPPVGTPMGGGFYIQVSTGVHDDLYCKALAFAGGGLKAAIVSCDVESLHRPTVETARALIERRTGIPGRNVILTATHSHSGPEMTPMVIDGATGEAGRLIRDFHADLPGKIAEAVRLAESNLIPTRVWTGAGHEDSVSFNRRFLLKNGNVQMNPGQLNPEIVRAMGPIDPSVSVVYFDTPDGKPLATAVNFALHATTFGELDFSADYPGVLAARLGEAKGPEMLTLFTNGCAGNINQVDVTSRHHPFGPGESARVGTILAAAVLKTYKQMDAAGTGPLQVRSEMVSLPPLSYSEAEVKKARQVVELSRKQELDFLDLVQANRILNVMETHSGKPIQAEVQVIALGDKVAWVGLPGEAFVELGLAIKLASPFRLTLVSELANGMLDYLPDRKAYEEGGYEVTTARCAEGCGETLVDAARRLLVETYPVKYPSGARAKGGMDGGTRR